MKPRTLSASLLLALASAHACADRQPQTSSETHFQCARDVDCAPGESCVARMCQAPSAPHDAGLRPVDGMPQHDGSVGSVPHDQTSTPPVMDAQSAMTWTGASFDCTSLPAPKLVTDVDRACDALAAAACARMDVCMPGAWLFPDQASLPHDVNLCRQRLTIACTGAMRLPGSPTPAAVNECASRLPSFSCKQVYEAERYGSGNGARRPLNHEAALELCGVRGTLPRSSPCTSDIQCADGACWVDCSNGRCQNELPCFTCMPLLTVGDECDVYDHRCPPGTFPWEEWTCTNIQGGKSCTYTRITCQPLGNEGDPCPGNGAQQSTVSTPVSAEPSDGCEIGLACNEHDCVRTLNEGDPCGIGSASVSPQASFRECDAFRGFACINRRCTRVAEPPLQACRYVRDGALCGPFDQYKGCSPCLYPARANAMASDAGAPNCTFDDPNACVGDAG